MHATEKKPQGKQPWVNGGFAHCYMFTASWHSLLQNTGFEILFLKGIDTGYEVTHFSM